MAERAGRCAFCASSVARGIGGVGVRTERYPLYIVRIAVLDCLHALRGGALDQPVRVDCHNTRTGIIGKTHARDLAFRDAAARLLAAEKTFRCHSERSRGIPQKNLKANATGSLDVARDDGKEACCRKDPFVCPRGSFRGYHISGAISWRRCAYGPRVSYYAAVGERPGVVC